MSCTPFRQVLQQGTRAFEGLGFGKERMTAEGQMGAGPGEGRQPESWGSLGWVLGEARIQEG